MLADGRVQHQGVVGPDIPAVVLIVQQRLLLVHVACHTVDDLCIFVQLGAVRDGQRLHLAASSVEDVAHLTVKERVLRHLHSFGAIVHHSDVLASVISLHTHRHLLVLLHIDIQRSNIRCHVRLAVERLLHNRRRELAPRGRRGCSGKGSQQRQREEEERRRSHCCVLHARTVLYDRFVCFFRRAVN